MSISNSFGNKILKLEKVQVLSKKSYKVIDDGVAFYKDALWYAIIGEEMINQSFCCDNIFL